MIKKRVLKVDDLNFKVILKNVERRLKKASWLRNNENKKNEA